MSTFQTDFAAAKTAIIKAFEHDYTPSFHALLQRLVQYFKLQVLLEPTRQWQHVYNLVSETLRKEPFTYVLTVFFEIQYLAMYIVKKTFDYFMLCVTMAYGSVVYGMSYVLDTPEKTNIAVNVIALNVFVFFCLWLVSLVSGTLFCKSTQRGGEEIETEGKESKSTSGKESNPLDKKTGREGEGNVPERAKG